MDPFGAVIKNSGTKMHSEVNLGQMCYGEECLMWGEIDFRNFNFNFKVKFVAAISQLCDLEKSALPL